jgi:Ca2+-binding RTX toxin-like protein
MRGNSDHRNAQGHPWSYIDSSVQPGDPETIYVTNDVPGCPDKGGMLSGTDKPDRLAGEDGEDELRGLGGSDHLTGGIGSDVVYGGPGNDELKGGGWTGYGDRSKDVLYGGDGDDFTPGPPGFPGGLSGGPGEDVLYGGDGNDLLNGGSGPLVDHQRDELYCGVGRDEYIAHENDYVDSSCEVKW